MKKQVIAYTHFHWDREWYKEYETFRFRLLKSFDIVLDMLLSEKLPSFYFDGQTAALLDYLEIYPQKKSLIKSLVKDKKLFIGPFYCLIDEFLTSKEVFKKNLELGLQTATEFGCTDFLAYFADTFGHSACTIPILKEFNINKAIVWRGCGDIPAEFNWKYKNDSIKTVNLIRGYFQDIFATNLDIDKKAEFLKTNLDKIAERSGSTLLLPIGADHLAVLHDLDKQIKEVNSRLKDYEIILGSPFDYFEKVDDNFKNFEHIGELRDNSKTFILEGSYSSRLDLKRLNVISSHKLKIASKLIDDKNLIDYAYKLLIQNQAHDSICGCSTDDVHKENIVRYKKVLQIANSIINNYVLQNKTDELQVLSLGKEYSGCLTFESEKELGYQVLSKKKGFPADIFNDIYKIPITEDYTDIYTYIYNSSAISDVFVSESSLKNSKISLQIRNGKVYIGDNEINIIDFEDLGDSYNFGPKKDDEGVYAELKSSKIAYEHSTSCGLELVYELKPYNELITIVASLCSNDNKIKFKISWNNCHKNHLLQLSVNTNFPIETTMSEDLGEIITRDFNPDYRVREHLPESKGIEVMLNNAPMQRGVCANDVIVVTEGITQYEVLGTELRLPLLRATGLISNALNTARTTPAGPPIEVEDLQQIGANRQDLWIGFGTDLRAQINDVYNECIVLL